MTAAGSWASADGMGSVVCARCPPAPHARIRREVATWRFLRARGDWLIGQAHARIEVEFCNTRDRDIQLAGAHTSTPLTGSVSLHNDTHRPPGRSVARRRRSDTVTQRGALCTALTGPCTRWFILIPFWEPDTAVGTTALVGTRAKCKISTHASDTRQNHGTGSAYAWRSAVYSLCLTGASKQPNGKPSGPRPLSAMPSMNWQTSSHSTSSPLTSTVGRLAESLAPSSCEYN